MGKTTSDPMLTLFDGLFRDQRSGYVEFRAIGNLGGVLARSFVMTPTEAAAFRDKYGTKESDCGVYFGVTKRASNRGKELLWPTAVWADIDTLKNGQNIDEVLRLATDELQPSAAVASGGGLHLYWFLDEPSDPDVVQQACALIGDIVGGDRVHDTARILRVPGSWNTKRSAKKRCELIYCHSFRRYSAAQLLSDARKYTKSIVDGKLLADFCHQPTQLSDAAADIIERARIHMKHNSQVAIETMWRDHVRHKAPRGYLGIHEAQVMTTAKLHSCGWADYLVVWYVVKLTQSRIEVDAPDECWNSWDWAAEGVNVRRMLDSWKIKWAEIKKKPRGKRANVSNEV